MPCSSPLWPEPPLSGCPPVTHPADMGTRRAAPLCWAILGLLMLRGQNSQPMTKTSQGNFSNQSLVTEPTSPSTGNRSSPEPGNPNLLLSTSAPAAAHTASHRPWVSNKPGTPRPSSEDAHSLSLALTQSQPRKNMSELAPDLFDGVETSQNATPNATTMSLTILPSPTSETVLTVAAFGVISFIVILVVVVIVLVGVVSLRFKCRKNKDSEDPQKPGSSGLSESCSTANGEKDSITLISMKNINMNNSRGCPSAEKVL